MDDLLGSLAIAAIFSRTFAWILGATLLVLAIGFVGAIYGANGVYTEGQERGFVVYCQDNGERRWIGECEASK